MSYIPVKPESTEDLTAVLGWICDLVNEGESLLDTLITWEIPISLILRNRKFYWFMFDNLNRQDAQLLWVWDFNYRRHGVCRDMSERSL